LKCRRVRGWCLSAIRRIQKDQFLATLLMHSSRFWLQPRGAAARAELTNELIGNLSRAQRFHRSVTGQVTKVARVSFLLDRGSGTPRR
jgi:hypothetical protein